MSATEHLRADCRTRHDCRSDEKCLHCSQWFICLGDIGEWRKPGEDIDAAAQRIMAYQERAGGAR